MAPIQRQITSNKGLRLLAVGLTGALLTLLGGAWIDMAFEGESFRDAFFLPNPHELAVRTIFLGAWILFLLYIASIWRKREVLERSLHAALETAQLEKEKSIAILDVVGDAISIQDLDLKVLYQNRAHQALMGNRVGEFCYNAYQQRDAVCDGCHLVQGFADGQAHRRESMAPSSHGVLHVEIISTPLRDASGTVIAGIESIRDITRRKMTEQSILSLNDELRKKTAELAALNRDLEAFSYSLSHDLKIPLTVIYGSAQVLHDTQSERLDETGRYLLEQINHAGERMEQLLDAMLQMAHHSQHALQSEAIDLSAMAAEILDALQLGDPHRRIERIVASGVERRGDPRLIRSALENLLGNAWKYTGQKERPTIEFGCEVREGSEICFVRDNGAGFDMQKAGRLFRPFQRFHSREEFAGNGIGLATAQQIIQRHGGRIWADAKPGEGATFYFTL